MDDLSAKAADARAAHAAMVERTSALEAEVVRLEEAARDVEQRIAARAGELEQARTRREALLQAIADETRTLDDDVRALDALRDRRPRRGRGCGDRARRGRRPGRRHP